MQGGKELIGKIKVTRSGQINKIAPQGTGSMLAYLCFTTTDSGARRRNCGAPIPEHRENLHEGTQADIPAPSPNG